jgi:hypothetical protein
MSKFKLFSKKDTLTKVEEVDEDYLLSVTKNKPFSKQSKFGRFPSQYTTTQLEETSFKSEYKVPTLTQTKPRELSYPKADEDSIHLENISTHNKQQILNILRGYNAVQDYIEDKDNIIIQLKGGDIYEYYKVVQKYLDDQLEERTRTWLTVFPKTGITEDKGYVKTPSLDIFSKIVDLLFAW